MATVASQPFFSLPSLNLPNSEIHVPNLTTSSPSQSSVSTTTTPLSSPPLKSPSPNTVPSSTTTNTKLSGSSSSTSSSASDHSRNHSNDQNQNPKALSYSQVVSGSQQKQMSSSQQQQQRGPDKSGRPGAFRSVSAGGGSARDGSSASSSAVSSPAFSVSSNSNSGGSGSSTPNSGSGSMSGRFPSPSPTRGNNNPPPSSRRPSASNSVSTSPPLLTHALPILHASSGSPSPALSAQAPNFHPSQFPPQGFQQPGPHQHQLGQYPYGASPHIGFPPPDPRYLNLFPGQTTPPPSHHNQQYSFNPQHHPNPEVQNMMIQAFQQQAQHFSSMAAQGGHGAPNHGGPNNHQQRPRTSSNPSAPPPPFFYDPNMPPLPGHRGPPGAGFPPGGYGMPPPNMMGGPGPYYQVPPGLTGPNGPHHPQDAYANFRRPPGSNPNQAGGRHDVSPGAVSQQPPDWKEWKAAQFSAPAPPQAMYMQQGARGSSSSVNSSNSGRENRQLPPGAVRMRSNEDRNHHPAGSNGSVSGSGEGPLPRPGMRQRTESQSSSGSASAKSPTATSTPSDRERSASVSSTGSGKNPPSSTAGAGAGAHAHHRPSPLSHEAFKPRTSSPPAPSRSGSVTPSGAGGSRKTGGGGESSAAEKEESEGSDHEDPMSDEDVTLQQTSAGMLKAKQKKTLGNKLRRALSMSAMQQMEENKKLGRPSISTDGGSPPETPVNGTSTLPARTGPPRAASSGSGRRLGLLNSKMNSSTDNISISSTVSSASVMIRKIGNLGKVARRSSLMGLSRVFNKEKEDEDDATLSETGVAPGTKLKKKDKKKSSLATTSVSHATVEVEKPSGVYAGMTPAEALVKKHQQRYAEQEAAASKSPPSSPAIGRSKTTDDVIEPSRAKMIEKEKERLKSRKGRKWGLGSFSGSKGDNGDEGVGMVERIDEGNLDGMDEEGYDQPTPRQSLEVLHDQPTPTQMSFGDDEHGRWRDDDDTMDPMTELEEYDIASLRSWSRDHRQLPHKLSIQPAKSILKRIPSECATPNELPPPSFPRSRANSYDAPHQSSAPNPPGEKAALVQVIPSDAQVDGLVHSTTGQRLDTHPPSPNPKPSVDFANPSASGPYNNPSMNASAPVLQNLPIAVPQSRSASTPMSKRISFAQNLSVHTTWPAAVYDRRSEPGTSNRLTPLLAQRIKEELNAYKMEEMEVHHASRVYTHFFV